mmetsp:Transcript_51509/g.60193  ORF Transcript_51509/g.60193 Transcript_51509/m.60193 type:complete len:98 (-) Transcript_51509:1276-1569(-)
MTPQQQNQKAQVTTTSEFQTILSILKGNIGPGCLSLPWSFSIVGVPLGCLITTMMTLLVSWNAWTLVVLKREMGGGRRFTYSVCYMVENIFHSRAFA